MTSAAVYTSLKAVGYIVLLAMAGTVIFAGYMAAIHWTGIGV